MILEEEYKPLSKQLSEDTSLVHELNAFSTMSRNRMLLRARGKSEISGLSGRLEASHINHDKSNPYYDDECTGIIMTPSEHYVYHLMFQGNSNAIGLPEYHNDMAINSLYERANPRFLEPKSINFIKMMLSKALTKHCYCYGIDNPVISLLTEK